LLPALRDFILSAEGSPRPFSVCKSTRKRVK